MVYKLRGSKRYKIIDQDGNIIKRDFINKTTARLMIPKLRINKYDKLEVVEDEEDM